MVTYPSILPITSASTAFIQSYLKATQAKRELRKQFAQEIINEYSGKYKCEYCGRSLLIKSTNCEGCGAPK